MWGFLPKLKIIAIAKLSGIAFYRRLTIVFQPDLSQSIIVPRWSVLPSIIVLYSKTNQVFCK